jgi:hypothetical protein
MLSSFLFERWDDQDFEGMPTSATAILMCIALLEYTRWLIEDIGFDGLRQ